MNDVKLHVGTAEDMAKRFAEAWHKAEQGQDVQESHLTFLDLDSLLAALTNKRMELLRHLHQQPARSVAALARGLGGGLQACSRRRRCPRPTGIDRTRQNHGSRHRR